MYKTELPKDLIEDGEKLLEKVEGQSFPVTAAFWRYFDEDMQWKLIIVSPTVHEQGPLRSYMALMKALDSLGSPLQLRISDISLMSPVWSQFQELRRNIEGAGVGQIRDAKDFRMLGGSIFEDFVIYRWNP